MISIVRGLPRFDGRSAFSTWVYRIATNAALDELRRRKRRPALARRRRRRPASPSRRPARRAPGRGASCDRIDDRRRPRRPARGVPRRRSCCATSPTSTTPRSPRPCRSPRRHREVADRPRSGAARRRPREPATAVADVQPPTETAPDDPPHHERRPAPPRQRLRRRRRHRRRAGARRGRPGGRWPRSTGCGAVRTRCVTSSRPTPARREAAIAAALAAFDERPGARSPRPRRPAAPPAGRAPAARGVAGRRRRGRRGRRRRRRRRCAATAAATTTTRRSGYGRASRGGRR